MPTVGNVHTTLALLSFETLCLTAGNPDEFDVRFNIRESRLITGGTGVTVGNNEGRAQLQV
jgi:hypothetical protein